MNEPLETVDIEAIEDRFRRQLASGDFVSLRKKLENAALVAMLETFGQALPPMYEVQCSQQTGACHMFVVFEIVDRDTEHEFQLSLDTLAGHDLEAEVGDELLFEVLSFPRGVGSVSNLAAYPWIVRYLAGRKELASRCAYWIQRALDDHK